MSSLPASKSGIATFYSLIFRQLLRSGYEAVIEMPERYSAKANHVHLRQVSRALGGQKYWQELRSVYACIHAARFQNLSRVWGIKSLKESIHLASPSPPSI